MSLKNRFKYFSHKYIRWFSAAFLALWIAFALAGIVALGHPIAAAAVAIAGLALFLLGRRFEIPVVSALTEVAMGIVATGVGVLEAIAGRNYQTWAPPARG